ncbi:4-alpha-L-fucosyltransferase glycosyl transferase group 56 [Marinobacter antarcticus]|uniref:4-alpha-L-fucosyltransferase glycosyl transferase group 56 n=1 Tax=Marinobacter antarcticus TaxID=564117 RepID=A0A1M6RW09_9GAMM|nr:TDP-N-acetylfucosamine:lipid II N-acetylfucosaminyltransferase [Marinobacter antarcticus]SHK36675.1 4-alpha-L-fucosyltransferase glycosyl transferase group 56 [Marinobacter antarcticus]
MILHVAVLDKFIPPFIKLINEGFGEEAHQFWFTGSIEKYPVEVSESVYVCSKGFWAKLRAYAKLILQCHSARKIILHGLFDIRVVLILALCPWVLPKCYWVIWGGDLYQYARANNAWRSRTKEVIRRFVIQRIGHLITYINGDVDLARKWYGAKGVHHECLMYLSNVVERTIISTGSKKTDRNSLRILLGNSADPSNNHIQALEFLVPYKDQDIKIFVPLSYGDQGHAKKVISQGREWFGEKFVPLTDFIAFDQYLEFLKSLDLAIFNHQRQQAMGNTITLLGMGKTVFMQSDVNHWRFLSGLGITLNDVAGLTLRQIDSEAAQENSRIVQSYFSRETLMNQLTDIFEG